MGGADGALATAGETGEGAPGVAGTAALGRTMRRICGGPAGRAAAGRTPGGIRPAAGALAEATAAAAPSGPAK